MEILTNMKISTANKYIIKFGKYEKQSKFNICAERIFDWELLISMNIILMISHGELHQLVKNEEEKNIKSGKILQQQG